MAAMARMFARKVVSGLSSLKEGSQSMKKLKIFSTNQKTAWVETPWESSFTPIIKFKRLNRCDQFKELVKRNWYLLDESVRTVLLQETTKYAIVGVTGGGGFVLLTNTKDRVSALETAVNGLKMEQKSVKEKMKIQDQELEKYHKETNEKFLMLAGDLKELKIASEAWIFWHIRKNSTGTFTDSQVKEILKIAGV